MKEMMSFKKYKQEFHKNFSKLNMKIEKNENQIEKLYKKHHQSYSFEKVSIREIKKLDS